MFGVPYMVAQIYVLVYPIKPYWDFIQIVRKLQDTISEGQLPILIPFTC
jgi:hypothetical protein